MDSKINFFLQEDENPESLWIPTKGENKKKRLSVDQVQLLEKNFNVLNKLEHDKKLHLAKEIGLQPRQVAVWFQNRRARSKNKKIENDYDSLNSEYDKLQKDYDNLLQENQRLKAEVDKLRGKRIANEKMKKNPLESVEAVDSSVTEFGKSNTRCFTMGSCRQEEGSRSSSKNDNFYSESPAMENQSQAADFFQVEQEEDLGSFGKLEDGNYVEELMDSYNIITAIEDQPFFFWS